LPRIAVGHAPTIPFQLGSPAFGMKNERPEYRFDELPNFRDIGSTINAFTEATSLKAGILYRSARPDSASEADRAHLKQTLGIKTIIDLRSKTEHINAVETHASTTAPMVHGLAIVPQATERVNSSLQIAGVNYAEINLNGGAFERALLWQLKYTSIAHLLWLVAFGYREDAIRILGREVMQPRGLIGLGLDTLDYSGREIEDVFNLLADENNYPVMVHCTHGKDRTGLIVLLVLMLCGVNPDAIAEDYMRSEEELKADMADRLRQIISVGLSEEFACCPENFVTEVVKHIYERHGGVKEYLSSIGIDGDSQQCICRIILRDVA
jgi:protein-tyrosine phosphatase